MSCGQGGVGVPGSSHRALATGTRADVSLAFLCCRDGTNCGLNGASVWLEDGIKAVCCNLAGCRGSFRPPASTPDVPTLYCHTKHSSFYTWNPINKENNFPVNPNQQWCGSLPRVFRRTMKKKTTSSLGKQEINYIFLLPQCKRKIDRNRGRGR